MNAADFDKLSDAEKEHFYWCSKCRQFVDKRELRDVIFHETDHRPKPHIPRIKGKPIPKRLSRRYNPARIVFNCRTANDPAMMSATNPAHVTRLKQRAAMR